MNPSKPVDEEEDVLENENCERLGSLGRASILPISHCSIMYAPKCLVLVSRLDYIDTFRVSDMHFALIIDLIQKCK